MSKPICNHGLRQYWLLLGLMLWMGVWCPANARAAEDTAGETSQRIHFWADKSVIYTKANRAELSGRVKVVQGKNTATADQMIIIFKGADTQQSGINLSSIEKIELKDRVRIEFDNNVAVSQTAVYFSAQRKLVLSGPGTKITNGQNELNCSTITYYRSEDRMECTSDGKAQVKAIIETSGSGLN